MSIYWSVLKCSLYTPVGYRSLGAQHRESFNPKLHFHIVNLAQESEYFFVCTTTFYFCIAALDIGYHSYLVPVCKGMNLEEGFLYSKHF